MPGTMNGSLVLALAGFGGILLNVLVAPMLSLVNRLRPARTAAGGGSAVTSVSVLVPVFNERENIVRKLENLKAALDDAAGVSCEVVIGSDGSTDDSADVAAGWIERQGLTAWRVFRYQNEGKCQTINKLHRASTGQVVVSTDADVLMPGDAIRRIAAAFREDGRLGCVSCVPVLSGGGMGTQAHYWNVEGSIRRAESDAGLLIVVTGWLYAYRRDAFREIPYGVMADDLWVPLAALLRGYRSIQLPAVAVPSERTDEATEVRRRRRVIAGGMDVVRRMLGDLARRPGLLLLLTAHKVNRWALPIWIALAVIGTLAYEPRLAGPYLVLLLALRMAMGGSRFRLVETAVWSPVGAFAEVVRNRDFARWQHTRKP